MANQEIMGKWIAELVSGNYAQTKGHLQAEIAGEDGTFGFCCLGVLCEVAVKEGVIPEPEFKRSANTITGQEEGPVKAFYGDQAGVLPKSVSEWAGFTYVTAAGYEMHIDDPHVNFTPEGGETDSTSLSCLNDVHEYNFNQIAETIRNTFVEGN